MDNLWQDLRYAVRSLARQPSFTLVAIGTLAIGIGANTVIYSAVNSTLLHPMPFENGDRFVRIWHTSPAGTMRFYPDPSTVNAWRERASTLDGIATYGSEQVVVRVDGEPELATGAAASVQLFPFLGVQPILGRAFVDADTVAGQNRVVLLSESLWKQWYSADPDVVGETIRLNDEPYMIIGVLPRVVQALYEPQDAGNPLDYQLWLPGANTQATVARLQPGVTVEQALEEIEAIHAQLVFPTNDAAGWPPEIKRPTALVGDELKMGLWTLFATVGFLLVLACLNVMNMLLVRGLVRTHELGLRTALGASRGRVFRQLLVESLLLTTTAALAAVFLTIIAIQLLQPLLPESLAALHQIRVDMRVLATTAALSFAIGIAFSFAPLSQLRTARLTTLLVQGQRSGTSTPRRSGIRSTLVGLQVALAAMLFVGAALMVKSLSKLNARDPGFDPENLVSFAVSLPEMRYPNPESRTAFLRDMLHQLRETPSVRHAALGAVDGVGFTEAELVVDGHTEPYPRRGMRTNYVSDGYFRTMGMPLREGREFERTEMVAQPSQVVINQNLANALWPGESAVGKRFRYANSQRWHIVIGVVANVELSGLTADPTDLKLYEPFTRLPLTWFRVAVRAAGDASDVIPIIKGAVWQVDSNLPLRDIENATDIVANANARPRFNALMLAAFAVIGLLLAVVGVYSVVSLALRHRTHELGIRAALGATESDGVRLMLGHGLRPVIGGIVVGLAGALGLSRFLQSQLFEVEPTDPATYGIVTAALTIAAFTASYIPARRASRVDPVEVLRVH